jgi:hypothetical protein
MSLFPDVRQGGDLHFSSTGQVATVVFEVNNSESETGKTKYKLAVSLLLSGGVLGFGLTCWETGCCSLYLPLMNIPLLEEELEELGKKSWKRVTRHALLSSLAR